MDLDDEDTETTPPPRAPVRWDKMKGDDGKRGNALYATAGISALKYSRMAYLNRAAESCQREDYRIFMTPTAKASNK